MLRRFVDSTAKSRLLRTLAIGSTALVSIATFAGSNTWEVHRQIENTVVTTLDAAAPAFTDVFHIEGSGSGTNRLAFDGAVEVKTNQQVSAPVELRVRFIPTGGTAPIEERTVYAGTSTEFSVVRSEMYCASRTMCVLDGTFEVEVVDPVALGATTVDLHWVATASMYGRGATTPADAILKFTQP